MATKAEIATKVLQKLTVIAADQTAATNDSTLVQEKYDSLYQLLKADDLVSWGSTQDIPTEAVIPVVGLVARECLEEFTVPPNVATTIMLDEDRYRGQLKTLEYNYYVPIEEPVYF